MYEFLTMCIVGVYNDCMKKAAHKRINITLPESTIVMLEKVAGKGSRSTFINDAIQKHIVETRKLSLRERVKEGAIANAERDLAIAREWFDIDDELWPE